MFHRVISDRKCLIGGRYLRFMNRDVIAYRLCEYVLAYDGRVSRPDGVLYVFDNGSE